MTTFSSTIEPTLAWSVQAARHHPHPVEVLITTVYRSGAESPLIMNVGALAASFVSTFSDAVLAAVLTKDPLEPVPADTSLTTSTVVAFGAIHTESYVD